MQAEEIKVKRFSIYKNCTYLSHVIPDIFSYLSSTIDFTIMKLWNLKLLFFIFSLCECTFTCIIRLLYRGLLYHSMFLHHYSALNRFSFDLHLLLDTCLFQIAVYMEQLELKKCRETLYISTKEKDLLTEQLENEKEENERKEKEVGKTKIN